MRHNPWNFICRYFIAVPHERPGQRHLYRIPEKSPSATTMSVPLCITCPLGSSLLQLRKQGRKPSADHHYAKLERTKDVSSEESELSPLAKLSLSSSTFPSASFRRNELLTDGSYSASIADLLILNATISPVQQQRQQSQISVHNLQKIPGSGTNSSAKIRKVLVKVAPCLFNAVIFSPKNTFFVRDCKGPNIPHQTLHAAPSGQLIFLLNNNTELRDKVAGLALPDQRSFFVETSGGYLAPVRLYLPPGLREGEEFKFPMVLHV